MIRAILREIEQPGTGKTQTRRTLKTRMDPGGVIPDGAGGQMDYVEPEEVPERPRYRVGDRLYIREAWRTAAHLDKFAPRVLPVDSPVFFEADAGGEVVGATGKFRQGMHMPRWASRLTLIVTDVRVQRLQEISQEDATAEGVFEFAVSRAMMANYHKADRDLYRDLWDSLNAGRGYGWDTNPWVAAYTFRPILGNIDQVRS